MSRTISLERAVPAGADAVVTPVFAGALEDAGVAQVAAARGFEAKVGQTMVLEPQGGAEGAPLRVLVGLGQREELDAAAFRRAGAAVARAGRRLTHLAVTVVDAAQGTEISRPVAAGALAEGIELGSYRYTELKSDPTPSSLEAVTVVGTGGAKVRAALQAGQDVAAGVCLARDLVNEPGGSLTPTAFAEAAEAVASEHGLEIDVMGPKAIAKAGLGGLLGVNRGSAQEPRMVTLTYEPSTARGSLALVGKGITFDSGGLSLKTADGMMTMKDDMGGAAAVLGAMSVLGAVGTRARVTAYLPMTDNMTGPDATRPGDVLRMRNGKTVEVLNTDAEGRLILADALSLASEAEPDAIVDVATLTGACMIALGNGVAGLMANDDGWRATVQETADRVGERIWPLPLPQHYRSRLDSDVADLRNVTAGRDGGALSAGLFLREFVGPGIPWAHIDIAGPAWATADDGEISKGATGYGVRLLAELARTFRRPR